MDIETVAKEIVDPAVMVHKALGPGLLGSTYQKRLAHELRQRGLQVEIEQHLPIAYEIQRLVQRLPPSP